jgi:hypothetical protein
MPDGPYDETDKILDVSRPVTYDWGIPKGKIPEMKTLLARTLLASAAVLSVTLAASAGPVDSPVQINRIDVAPALGESTEFAPGQITVSFTNTEATPATAVDFEVHGYKGHVIGHIEDTGTFTQGAVINHSFADRALDNNQSVEVESVEFADGSTWSKPVLHPVVRRQASN